MNERIKELAEQATTKEPYYPAGSNGHPEYRYDFNKEKFAELIVQDCLWQIVKDDRVPQNIQALIGERFKEHFGVEE
jgi:hypothetical protein